MALCRPAALALALTAAACASPVGDDHAVCGDACSDSRALAPTELDIVAADGGQVTVAWQPPPSIANVAEYWLKGPDDTTLAKVTADDTTATVVADGTTRVSVAAVDSRGRTLGTSKAVTIHAIQSSRYQVSDSDSVVPVDGLRAHVWGPTDGNQHPIVFILHGNHNTCVGGSYAGCASRDVCSSGGGSVLDNAGGFGYLGRVLARKGYAVASIDGNELNCGLDRVGDRAELIAAHLDLWRQWNGGVREQAPALAARVDLSRVGLVGHSRGGEAVVAATELLTDVVGGQVAALSLAPTDHDEVVATGADLLMVLPGCDGDVRALSGQYIWSRTARSDSLAGELHQVVVPGTGHNRFNRTLLEPNSTCPPAEQRSRGSHETILAVLAGAWFDARLMGAPLPRAAVGAPEAFPRMDAAGANMDLRWSYVSPGRQLVEAGDGDVVATINELGGRNQYADLSGEVLFSPGRRILSLFWSSGEPRISHELAGFDASGFSALSFQVAVTAPESGVGHPTDALLRLSDTDGLSAELLVSELASLEAQPEAADPLHVPRTIRIPVEAVLEVNPELDWSSLSTFEIELAPSGLATGLWQYGDLAFSP